MSNAMNESQKSNILVVDDRHENLLALEKLLNGPDLNIMKATSGNDALALVLEYDFALVLLDVQMPEMDGFETAELMKGSEKTRDIPIIFLTAISKEQSHVFKGYEAGAVDYLFKPLEPEILKGKVKVFLDLYRQKKALERTTSELQQTIIDLRLSEEELKKAKERTEAAIQVKSEFLANMSHEIRTPMNIILGMEDLLRESPLTPEQEEYLQGICSSGEALLNLIDDIMDLSKVEAGRLELEHIDFDLEELFEKSCQIMAMRAREKMLDLSWQIMPAVTTELVGDPARLRQILINLIRDAIKFTEKGKVAVEVLNVDEGSRDTLKSEIRLLFSVRVTEIGISREKIENVFEKFTQADTFATGKNGEMGLGLAISKNLAELMGGCISVKSPFDQGLIKPDGTVIEDKFKREGLDSLFYFTVDFQIQTGRKRQIHPSLGESAMASKDLRALRILVVEDHAQNLMLIRSYLDNTPYRIVVAENGKIAIEKFISEKYDLVLMDIQMPVMDGYSATRAIREWEKENHLEKTPVIALSAGAYGEDLQKSLGVGCSAHLIKPIKKSKLIDAIEKYASRDWRAEVETKREVERVEESKPIKEMTRMDADKAEEKHIVTVDPELKGIIPEFFKYTQKDIESMHVALAQADYETIQLLGHSMKGSSGGYGFDTISDIGRFLENAAKDKDSEKINKLLEDLLAYIECIEIVYE